MKSQQKILLVALTLLLLTLGGCIKKSSTTQNISEESTLRWATSLTPENRDWTRCSTPGCFRHASLVMEGLTRVDPQATGDKTALALAADIKKQNDREYRIEIRKGVRWSDGRELTARDFVTPWKKNPLPRKTHFEKGGMKILSALVFSVRLTQNNPYFMRLLAHPALWPRRYDSKETPTLGPFIVDSSLPCYYRKNPSYYGTPAKFDAIQFLISSSIEERIGLYREHSVDVVEDIPTSIAARLSGDPDLIAVAGDSRIYLQVDPSQKPFQSSSVRQAFLKSLQTEETLRLLKTPLLPIQASAGDPTVLVKALPLSTRSPPIELTWSPADLEPIARNLQAQWAKNLKIEVALLPKTEKKAQLALREWQDDWFAPILPPFSAPQHVDEDNLILPLFQRAKMLLKNPRIGHLLPSPIGGWFFSSFQFG